MQQRYLYTLIIAMSLSLVGIMAIQIYWILHTIRDKEEQFSFAIKQTLVSVANDIEKQEVERYYEAVESLRDSLGVKPKKSTIRSFLIKKYDQTSDEVTTYSNSILMENIKLNSRILDIEMDSVTFQKFFNKKVTTTTNTNDLEGGSISISKRYEEFDEIDDFNRKQFKEFLSDISATLPITNRVDEGAVRQFIANELRKRQILSRFEFAIYQDGFLTRIQSDRFDLKTDANWKTTVFKNNNDGVGSYDLYINLPDRKRFILSSILGIAALSLFFTAIIVITYSSAIAQLLKQRQISQIKSDFINNMTHEFKTPIATINLALDSIKNPKIGLDPERLKSYLGMIREENKRMHSQVENVLRISRLEKNELDIEKQELDIEDVLEDSISHVWLILEQREGSIKTHFKADNNAVVGNESHLTNVFVNVLENAIKYTPEDRNPEIEVFTENVRDQIVIKVKDNGIGMSKAAQKKVFQKFFREHTGDIHNVKGHGLGLAYAKRILDEHDGEIFVESVKDEGSTFIINLPLIK